MGKRNREMSKVKETKWEQDEYKGRRSISQFLFHSKAPNQAMQLVSRCRSFPRIINKTSQHTWIGGCFHIGSWIVFPPFAAN